MKVKFKRFSTRARCLQKPTDVSAGYGLFSARNILLEPHSPQCFSKRVFCKNLSRSGLPSRSVDSGAGIIDSDFRGNVKVALHNLSDRQVQFEATDRIAQTVFPKS